jgi:hypothetical protein
MRRIPRVLTSGRWTRKGCVDSSTPGGEGREHVGQQVGVGQAAQGACWAFFIFEAATSSIALVIWRVFLTDLMRRRMSRVLAIEG